MGGIDDITALLEKAERLNTELSDGTLIRNAVVVYEGSVVASNREQMYRGLRSDNTRITPEYTPNTIEIKQYNEQPYDRVTLKDTGRFYNEMGIIYGDDSFEITSEDWKTEKLKEKYGDYIFGLNEQDQDALAVLIKDVLLEDIYILFDEQ